MGPLFVLNSLKFKNDVENLLNFLSGVIGL